MLTIDFETAKKHLTAAVEERGEDFTYQPRGAICLYQFEGKADCGVGEVFARSGVNMEANFSGNSGANSCRVDLLKLSALAEPFNIEPKALDFLLRFQSRQDQFVSWGDALEAALYEIA